MYSVFFFRITPAYVIVIIIASTIIDRFGGGPFWPIVIYELRSQCQQNWWGNLLYIHNYFDSNYKVNIQVFKFFQCDFIQYFVTFQCIPVTWYLSVDMQLYFIAPILLLALKNWPRATVGWSALLLILSVIIPFVYTWEYELPVHMLKL